MEIKEAIERLEGRRMTVSMCATSEECRRENEAIKMAIEALEAKMNGGENNA